MAAIDPRIFDKSFLRKPTKHDAVISNFCESISPGQVPKFVPVVATDESQPLECFHNVWRQVEQHGGSIAFGWAIWIWPQVFVEAEHHAVWEKDGKVLDITPREDGESEVLFLPDPERTYDFDRESRIDNQRFPIAQSLNVLRLLSAYAERSIMIEENSIGRVSNMNAGDFEQVQQKIINTSAHVLLELATKTRRNATCICSSGRKFKKCCQPLLHLRS